VIFFSFSFVTVGVILGAGWFPRVSYSYLFSSLGVPGFHCVDFRRAYGVNALLDSTLNF
jgi:hypothetical protein